MSIPSAKGVAMGLADWFRKRPPAEPPGDLRQALMAAVSRKDFQAVARLVSDNQQNIRESFQATRRRSHRDAAAVDFSPLRSRSMS
jgi:hypothetical protein